ncbi:uncharacterized protein FMAN_07785 [Fusarium mangiferae]|uniref:Uncharacterized protein n=1 Tax=Fusarium mangiferae TaxID=192010 RepID=A0A1L7TU26_FUSMA|nr:uncharacterized protein FMAN_07785 [Fusarium mangiferae]CVL01509.1 uncharacterized protein FMAN_07785 [Fusarium mangiferae]
MSHKRWAIQRPGSCIDRPKPRTAILGDDHDAWGSITHCTVHRRSRTYTLSSQHEALTVSIRIRQSRIASATYTSRSKRVRDNSLQRQRRKERDVFQILLFLVFPMRDDLSNVSCFVESPGDRMGPMPEPTAYSPPAAHRQPLSFSASSTA